MKLNKIEKIIVVILVIGVILGVGIFMFVKPSFDKIGVEQNTLANYQKELAELNDKLSRLDTIDGDIQAQKDSAKKYEGKFYPEMTTYETSELAMALLKAANLEAHAIQVGSLSTNMVSLQYYLEPEIAYDLKTFAATAKADPDNAGDTVILESGEFMDGNKKYSVAVDSVCNVVIADENDEVVEPSRYTDTMKKIYKAAVCRFAQENNRSQTTAVMTATYQVTGRYADYMAFIDHIYSLEKATTVQTVIIPVTVPAPTTDEDEDTQTYYVDEAGLMVSANEVEGDQQIVVDDDTIVEQNLTIYFLAIDPMQEVTRVDADGTEIVVDQRPAVY